MAKEMFNMEPKNMTLKQNLSSTIPHRSTEEPVVQQQDGVVGPTEAVAQASCL